MRPKIMMIIFSSFHIKWDFILVKGSEGGGSAYKVKCLAMRNFECFKAVEIRRYADIHNTAYP